MKREPNKKLAAVEKLILMYSVGGYDVHHQKWKKNNSIESYFTEWPSISRIKNSIKLYWVQYILRNFYYTTMQKLCEFEVL